MSIPDLFLQERKVVSVLPAAYVGKAYSYALPEGSALPEPGTFVRIPLHSRTVFGVVWEQEDLPPATGALKEILEIYDLPPLSGSQRKFIDRLADYTLSPLGAVLKMTLSAPAAFDSEKGISAYRALAQTDIPEKYRQVMAFLQGGEARTTVQITAATGCSAGMLKTMLRNNFLEKITVTSPPPCEFPDPARGYCELSPAQDTVAQALSTSVRQASYSCTLLDGVTGSGKTEVYFEAVAEALRQEKQVLILLPEIALSNAFLDRFQQRFGCAPALWHSALTPAQRRHTWRGVCTGRTKVVVGARSALHLPFPSLGVLIVDEEHDPAYKQEEQVIYHARDMAVLRAHLEKIPIILVSATPSLETMQNVWEGRYQHLELPARFGGAQLPQIDIVDMRDHKPPDSRHFLSDILRTALQEALTRKEQGLLFLNRRGYAPLTLCRSCGHRFECPRCSAWLTEHRHKSILCCHHCDYSKPYPEVCPVCGDSGSLAPCGPGVERIAEEVKEYFPDSRIEVLASDMSENHDVLKAALTRIRNHEVDVIIGTQIIAKGHHFPKLTCVGVVDADLGLEGGDLRATEKTYHLLHQVAGRAGRESLEAHDPGRVFLQTWMPDHPVMQALAAGARDGFLQAEAAMREAAHMPPYSRLSALIVSGTHEAQTLEIARQISAVAPQTAQIRVLGPAPAPLSKIRNKFRYRLLVIADKSLHIQKTLRHWLGEVKVPAAVQVSVDIDPQSFL
ncbi:MAG: primosomal protein N' [Rhodospirillales bacterium]|nr:primosomal protein N' [Rhodospirillales bacterium]